ncbi:hypothetical protein Q7A_03815 [Methylophaga nitratireducenticrescens]|nr:hypothetical protein Q7A_03815 [Methylophaga nitratireducenticrescens]AUZ85391.1 hypothetical protein CDW43_12815 [Methylophaga nitratireducenticrescens]
MGHDVSHTMTVKDISRALKQAIRNRLSTQPLLHHSDRGVQYCSQEYQNHLNANAIKPSMTDGYDCYQNALAERVNGILKHEFLLTKCRNLVLLIFFPHACYKQDQCHPDYSKGNQPFRGVSFFKYIYPNHKLN